MSLKTDYKDDILAVGNLRKYQMIQNNDGTVSFQDVTQYEQTGDVFGAGDINRTNQAVNEKFDSGDVVDPMLTTEPGFAADAYQTKLQFDAQNKKFATIGEHTLLASTVSTSETIFTVEDLKKFKYLLLTTTADVYRVNPTLIPVSLFKSSVNLEWQSGYNDGTKGWYVIAKYVSDTQVNLRVTGNGGHLYGVK